jgi:hypothetical protein
MSTEASCSEAGFAFGHYDFCCTADRYREHTDVCRRVAAFVKVKADESTDTTADETTDETAYMTTDSAADAAADVTADATAVTTADARAVADPTTVNQKGPSATDPLYQIKDPLSQVRVNDPFLVVVSKEKATGG